MENIEIKKKDTTIDNNGVSSSSTGNNVAGTGDRTLKKKIGAKKDMQIEEKKVVKIVATPKADPKATVKIFDMLEQAANYKQLKKGVNEVLKVLGKHKAEAVILAADTEPLELLMSVPQLCEQNSVPYCFVESSAALGRACGIQR